MNRLFALLSVTLVLALYMLVFNIKLQEPRNLGVVTISSDLVPIFPDQVTIVPTIISQHTKTAEPEATIGPIVTIIPEKNNLVTISSELSNTTPSDQGTITCQEALAPWSNELSLVMQKLQRAIELGLNNDHFTAKDTVASAILMYQYVAAPTCDNDAMEYHRLIGTALTLYLDAYTAAFQNENDTAKKLFDQSYTTINHANDVFIILKQRYQY